MQFLRLPVSFYIKHHSLLNYKTFHLGTSLQAARGTRCKCFKVWSMVMSLTLYPLVIIQNIRVSLSIQMPNKQSFYNLEFFFKDNICHRVVMDIVWIDTHCKDTHSYDTAVSQARAKVLHPLCVLVCVPCV